MKADDSHLRCPHCNMAFEWRHKWNNGNPGLFAVPQCNCEETK